MRKIFPTKMMQENVSTSLCLNSQQSILIYIKMEKFLQNINLPKFTHELVEGLNISSPLKEMQFFMKQRMASA